MSPRIGYISVPRSFSFISALVSSNILKRLNSEISKSKIFLGLYFTNCLTISEPIEPPAPVTKNSLVSLLLTIKLSISLGGNKSSRDKF